MKKILFLLILLAFIGCEKDDDNNSTNENEFQLEETSFRAILPEDVTIPENKTFKFANAYGEYITDQSNGSSNRVANGFNNNQTSSQVSTLIDGGFQLNYLLDNNDNIVMCTIANLQTPSEEYLIDAETTAISLLMTHPLIITSFQENYNGIVQTLKNLDSFDQYVTEVSQLITSNIEQNNQLDYSDTTTYRQLIIDLYNETMENAQVPLANGGLQFDLQSRINGELTYTFTNHFKRTLHIYPKKVWLDSNGIPISEEEYEDNIFPLMDVMTADGLSIWNTITTFNFSEPYEKTTDPITINLDDADQLKLEVYGVGKLHKDFEELSNEELLKMSIVGVHGGYRDFIRPLFDMILGLKNFQTSTNNDQHFDFRYGSRKQPLTELFRELATNFSSDPIELDNLRENLQNEDYLAIAWQFPKYSVNQILSDSQPEEERRRYLNYIYNAMKNITGVSSTSDSFREAIKKGANQISGIKNANFVGQVINIGELSVDVASAIYAYNQSEFKEDVRVNKTSETLISLLTPQDNYLIEDNESSLFFEWDFDRGNHIGNVTFELIILDASNNSILQSIDTQNNKYYNLSLNSLNLNINQFDWQVIAKSNGNTLTSSEAWSFITTEQTTVTDIDGNIYQTVQIGNQIWMAENLKVTKFRNGDQIPTGLADNELQNTSEPAYVTLNVDLYGHHYNWFTFVDSRGICPDGFRVPIPEDLTELNSFLQGDGGKLKSMSNLWTSPNTGATNSTGFTAEPAGQFRFFPAQFHDEGTNAIFWTSAENSTNGATHFGLSNENSNLSIIQNQVKVALRSCRCIKE